ncbi:MAG TPA: hypothetical protein VGO59_16245, partial [Verrucomicrobiae bacterium]
VADCPLRCSSPNAPSLKDLLGAWVLASLSGAWRYAHVTALRGDRVNPQGLGMEKVASEDSLRRAFQDQDGTELALWQTEAVRRTHAPALEQPWIADLDVTVKPICGHQEGRSGDIIRTSRGVRVMPVTPCSCAPCGWRRTWRCVRARNTPACMASPTCGGCAPGDGVSSASREIGAATGSIRSGLGTCYK